MQTLHTARTIGKWTGDAAVFVTGDVTPCARRVLAGLATVIDVSTSPWVGVAVGPNADGPQTTTHYAKLQLFSDPQFRKYSRILYLDADIAVRTPLAGLLAQAPARPGAALALDVYQHDRLYRELSVPPAALPAAFRAAHADRPGVHQTNVMWIYVDQLPAPDAMGQRLREYLQCCGHLINKYYEQGLLLFAFYNNTVMFHGLVLLRMCRCHSHAVRSAPTYPCQLSFGPDAVAAHANVVAALDHQFHFRLAWHPRVGRFANFARVFAAAAGPQPHCFQAAIALGRPALR